MLLYTGTALFLWAAASMVPPIPKDFRVLQHGEVRLEIPEDRADWLADYPKDLAEFQSSTEAFLGRSITGEFTFRLMPNRSRYEKAQPEGVEAPQWAVGLAYAPLRYTVINLEGIHPPFEEHLMTTLRHEAIHLWVGWAMQQGDPQRDIPRWFEEAMAIRLSEEWDLERTMALMEYLFFNSPPPLEEMNRKFHSRYDATPAYLLAQDFLDSLLLDYGMEPFRDWVRRLAGSAAGFEEAFLAAYGFPISNAENDWHSSLGWRYRWIPLIGSSTFLWAVASLMLVIGYFRKKRKEAPTDSAWRPPPRGGVWDEDGHFVEAEDDEWIEHDDGDGDSPHSRWVPPPKTYH